MDLGTGKWITLTNGTWYEVLRGQVCSLLVLGGSSSPDPGHLYSWFSGPWLRLIPILLTHLILKPFKFELELYHWLSSASSLQWADGGTSQSPKSCESIPHHKHLSIYSICVNPLDSVSLENSK